MTWIGGTGRPDLTCAAVTEDGIIDAAAEAARMSVRRPRPAESAPNGAAGVSWNADPHAA